MKKTKEKETLKSLKRELIAFVIVAVIVAIMLGFAIGVVVNFNTKWTDLIEAYENHLVRGPN